MLCEASIADSLVRCGKENFEKKTSMLEREGPSFQGGFHVIVLTETDVEDTFGADREIAA